MKARFFLPVAFSMLFAFCAAPTSAATLITFDDFLDIRNGDGTLIANKYASLVWSNFGIGNEILHTINNGPSGYYYGMVTPSNVAFNAFGDPAEIKAVGTNFNFLSAYLTGAWNSNLNIEVQGFRGGALIYDQTVVAAATNPTLFAFNYLDIDRLYFSSFGGQSAGFSSSPGENFAMDNFTFEVVPEPSSLLLTSAGVLTLCVLRKRRRA
jgi:hypothetical protein